MGSSGTALLFVPPLPPVQLPVRGTLVVGRSGGCDLRLRDADTSRRHAKIVCEEERIVLHDLASTNGTFVNGQRVEERALAPGDRIQIGSNEIAFCRVEADLDPEGPEGERGDDQTQLFLRPRSTDVFQGDLAQIPPFAVVQILEMGHKTGALQIDGETWGRLWFVEGDPVHAETKDQLGFDAAITLVSATAGRFAFEPDVAAPEGTIQASVTQLLLEAARQLDEALVVP
jgi:pSer/pThr/pTyr-binding forkhead associated (FHA) protein